MAVAMVPTASALLVPFDHLPISSPAFFTDTCPLLRPFATILNPRCQNPIAMSSDESHDCTHLQINEHDVAIWPQGGRGSSLAQGERSATFSGDFGAGPRMGPFAFLGQRIWRDFGKGERHRPSGMSDRR